MMQPLCKDEHGVVRFKENEIVRYLLDNGGIDLNHLGGCEFQQRDWDQFYQLIGTSVSGYGDLSNVSRESADEADTQASRQFYRPTSGPESGVTE